MLMKLWVIIYCFICCSLFSVKAVTSAPSIFEGMLGEKLYAWSSDINTAGETTPFVYEGDTNTLLRNKRVVGLYFSASWCGPCRKFTPQLVRFYNEMKSQGHDFEIVWISSDQSTEDFLSYFQEMPWLAVTLDNINSVSSLLTPRYDVRGIPHLVILDGQDASVYTLSGRTKVMEDAFGLEFPWKPRSLWNLVPRPLKSILNEQVFKLQSRLISSWRKLLQILGIDFLIPMFTRNKR